MMNPLEIQLDTTAEQAGRLQALQAEFAAACNAIAPVAQTNHCWNRVALHHLTYHEIRQRFPQLGSQMVCNAVYSVARTYRLILGHPASPWRLDKRPPQPLPLLRFQSSAPVYFDRHTLSLRHGQLSMYTLDGRIRFQLKLVPAQEQAFVDQRLREIILLRSQERYLLQFWFAPSADSEVSEQAAMSDSAASNLPEYVLVLPAPEQAVTATPA